MSGVGAISSLIENARGGQRGSALLLDPTDVELTEWADRDESSFASAEFEELKDSIRLAGGNIQPIKVRPSTAKGEGGQVRYQLIYGSRRLRACKDLQLKVRAVVESVDGDRGLYLQMVGENRGRMGLSPWEQGRSYHHAIRKGLFKSQAELVASTGLDQSNVSKAMRIAELPDEVMTLFPSPTVLTFRAGTQLTEALRSRAESVLANAAEIRGRGLTDAQSIVKALLVETGKRPKAKLSRRELSLPGDKLGRVEAAADGSVRVLLPKGTIRAEKLTAFLTSLERAIRDLHRE
jgi:ParB family chromosome partitioning protein